MGGGIIAGRSNIYLVKFLVFVVHENLISSPNRNFISFFFFGLFCHSYPNTAVGGTNAVEERKADDESTAAAADDDSNEVRWQKKKNRKQS
jgi:hypothetical protein